MRTSRLGFFCYCPYYFTTLLQTQSFVVTPSSVAYKIKGIVRQWFSPQWMGPWGWKKKSTKRKRSHGCCGRVPLAIGAGTTITMAIVASAFNSDHPNMLSPSKVGYVSFSKKLTLSSSIDVNSFEQNLDSNVDRTTNMCFYL
jgi:hypothetical protein